MSDRIAYVEHPCVKDARLLAKIRDEINVRLVARPLFSAGNAYGNTTLFDLHWEDYPVVVNSD